MTKAVCCRLLLTSGAWRSTTHLMKCLRLPHLTPTLCCIISLVQAKESTSCTNDLSSTDSKITRIYDKRNLLWFCESLVFGMQEFNSWFWVKELSLTYEDKDASQENEMLTDKHMQAVHTLFAKQFPHLDSLQSPLLVQNGSFQPLACDGGYLFEGLSSSALQVLQYCHKVLFFYSYADLLCSWAPALADCWLYRWQYAKWQQTDKGSRGIEPAAEQRNKKQKNKNTNNKTKQNKKTNKNSH